MTASLKENNQPTLFTNIFNRLGDLWNDQQKLKQFNWISRRGDRKNDFTYFYEQIESDSLMAHVISH